MAEVIAGNCIESQFIMDGAIIITVLCARMYIVVAFYNSVVLLTACQNR